MEITYKQVVLINIINFTSRIDLGNSYLFL